MRKLSNHEQPLVSVVMPVHNAESFLKQAIDSVLNQTYQNIELIMVDDCSKDASLRIMSEYAEQDSRVQVIRSDRNRGVACARNIGIQAAKGDYVAFLDSDDVWLPEKLEKQLRLLRDQNAEISYCSVDFVDEKNQKLKSFLVPKTTDYNEMLYRCVFICSTVVVEAKLLKAHPFNPKFYHEDLLLWIELLALKVKAVGETSVQAQYRIIQGSRSNNKLNAAKNRWKIYREALGMNFFHSSIAFVRYAFWGVVKYV